MPSPHSVDIVATLASLRAVLAGIDSPDQKKIGRAIDDAEEEARKPEPDKTEIGSALERALSWAKAATGFAEKLASLQPHLVNAAAWLGAAWHQLLSAVQLSF